MSDHSISVIDQLMKNVVARLLYLRECAEGDDVLLEQIDAAIQESSTVSHKHEIEVAHLVHLMEELRGQRDSALDDVEVYGVAVNNLERQVDDLIFSMEDLRDRARDPEVQVAAMMYLEMDFDNEADARIAMEILTGRSGVYLSHYIKGDLREMLEVAIEEVKETQLEMEADGGVAE